VQNANITGGFSRPRIYLSTLRAVNYLAQITKPAQKITSLLRRCTIAQEAVRKFVNKNYIVHNSKISLSKNTRKIKMIFAVVQTKGVISMDL
jgi:hypothetical protein